MDKHATFSASLASASLLVYVVFATLPIHFAIIFSLFILTTALFLWMVFRVLTDTSVAVTKTFDEYFYQDADLRKEAEKKSEG